jgi:starch phosphorylase
MWADLNGGVLDRHPVTIIGDLSLAQLEDLLDRDQIMDLVSVETELLDEMMGSTTPPEIAYFSPEFGLSDVVPQYSGGLGILAGDHLKAASELGMSLVGVGLFYREGFFRQRIADGSQVEDYPPVAPEDLGAVDTGLTVTVPFPGRSVVCRIWHMDVGRTRLVLLDTDVPANAAADRKITDRLYSGDRQHRLEQELILGVGGTRALAALGWDLPVYHLNEGHAGFLVLELIDRAIENGDLAAAVDTVRPGLVFTTHTPVPAGIDRFDRALIEPYLALWAAKWGIPVHEIWELGADPVHARRSFNMAALALRMSSDANGVSRLHGEVSRQLFAGVGIGDHIGSITNGVHARTWVAGHTQEVFDRVLGPEWALGDATAWSRVEDLSDAAITSIRRDGSAKLSRLVARTTGQTLDPEALIIGFARRFATYKRATLLLEHPERLAELLADQDRPVHFVFAGKAHPADKAGKALLAGVVAFSRSAQAGGRFTFIPDYGIEIARRMYDGCDVWLNNPVRPREASGTSGEKSALNGGLNCSILDGWWAEMFDGHNGWDIATSDATDPDQRDAEESAAALDRIEEIIAEYHGASNAFISRVRHNWRSLGPQVTATRMVAEYRDTIYGPAISRVR